MENSELDFGLIVAYPGISALNNEETKFGGYIQINGQTIKILLDILEYKNFNIELPKNLKNIEAEINEVVNSFNFKHLLHVLNKLTQLLKEHILIPEEFKTDLCSQVLNEYYQFNQYHLNVNSSYLSPDLKRIQITNVDEYRRKHNIQITVNSDSHEGPMFKIAKFELPEDENQFEGDDSLVELYKRIVNAVKRYQEFFNLMDEIDKNCWVLDPESPSRKDIYRRISITDKVSLIATFNPNNPNEIPKIIFMGPQNLTSELQARMYKNFADWDVNMHPLQEMLKILELENFPGKPMEDNKDDGFLVTSDECCICFALRLDDKLPEIICPNSSCNRYFHISCLHQWLWSIHCRQLSDEVIGQCPCCEKNISCPLPKNF